MRVRADHCHVIARHAVAQAGRTDVHRRPFANASSSLRLAIKPYFQSG
jgi:hypothetical protein